MDWTDCLDCEFQFGQLVKCTSCDNGKTVDSETGECEWAHITSCLIHSTESDVCDICDDTHYVNGQG